MAQYIDKGPLIGAAIGKMQASLAGQKAGNVDEYTAMYISAEMIVDIVFAVLNEVEGDFAPQEGNDLKFIDGEMEGEAPKSVKFNLL